MSIELENLGKVYPDGKEKIVALRDINLHVARGTIFGLLGPNGAGKTTIIKILATVLLPTTGAAYINELDVVKNELEVKGIIGWCSGSYGSLYLRLTGFQNLRFWGALYGISQDVLTERINHLLDFFQLKEYMHKLVKDYSTGMKAKLNLARCLLHNPDVLLLDEPLLGVDVIAAAKIKKLLRFLSDKLHKTIIYTSHNLREVEELCDEIGIINQGQLIALQSVEQLKSKIGESHVLLLKTDRMTENHIEEVKLLPPILGIVSNRNKGTVTTLEIAINDLDKGIEALVKFVRSKKRKLYGISVQEESLEHVFLKLVEGGI